MDREDSNESSPTSNHVYCQLNETRYMHSHIQSHKQEKAVGQGMIRLVQTEIKIWDENMDKNFLCNRNPVVEDPMRLMIQLLSSC